MLSTGCRKEALDLVGVQVHGQDAVNAGGSEHVGDQFGGDGDRATNAAGDPGGRSRNRDGGGDAAGRGALQGIDHHQFHQVVVAGGRRGRLQDEDVAAAHVLLELDADFAVGKAADVGAAKVDIQVLALTSAANLGLALPVKTIRLL